METDGRPVLFFDGVCNLCNRAVQFVIKHDKKQIFLFAPLQGIAGAAALTHLPKTDHGSSVVLLYRSRYYTRSTAVLQTLKLLGGAWYAFIIFFIIPRFLRDGLYHMIASRRYRLFGKADACMVPTPALQARFLQ